MRKIAHEVLCASALAFVLLCSFASVSKGDEFDSCRYTPAGSAIHNPDSVQIDSCVSTSDHLVYYTQKFHIRFDTRVVDAPYGVVGSRVEVSWQAIDSNFTAIRKSFREIDSQFGAIKFVKNYPADTGYPYTRSQSFTIELDSIANWDSLFGLLSSLQHTVLGINAPVTSAGVQHIGADELLISPNPAFNYTSLRVIDKQSFSRLHGSIELVDCRGFLLKRIASSEEDNCIRLPLDDYPSGIYYIRTPSHITPLIHLR